MTTAVAACPRQAISVIAGGRVMRPFVGQEKESNS